MLPCYAETCPAGKLPLRSLASLPAHRSSFHLTHPWRASLFIPSLACSTARRARKGPEGRLCVPAPHTPSPCLGWSQHTPGPHPTGCLDSVPPSPATQREEETSAPQTLHLCFLSFFSEHSFPFPLCPAVGLPQPISEVLRHLQTQVIPRLPQPDTELLVTITRAAVPLLCEQRAVGAARGIPQESPAGFQVPCVKQTRGQQSSRPHTATSLPREKAQKLTGEKLGSK